MNDTVDHVAAGWAASAIVDLLTRSIAGWMGRWGEREMGGRFLSISLSLIPPILHVHIIAGTSSLTRIWRSWFHFDAVHRHQW